MKAINFNRTAKSLTEGEIFDFVAIGNDGTTTALTLSREGDNISVSNPATGGVQRGYIFRERASILDMISIILRRPLALTSGPVYRAETLRIISEDYGSEIYNGVHAPSHDFVTNYPNNPSTDYFLGFELEVQERNEDCYRALSAFESNVWRMVTDGSISSGRINGIEYVSTLLDPTDAIKPSFFEPFCNLLTGLAKSKSTGATGLHCHISRTAFGANEATQNDNIAKLVYLENYLLSQDSLNKVFGRSVGEWARMNRSASGIIEHVSALQSIAGASLFSNSGIRDAITRDLLEGNKSRCGHNYPQERYRRINVTNRNTIEFRQGKGSINSGDIAIIAQHVVTVVKYVCATKWANLSEAGYIRTIPTSAKYARLRDIFTGSND